MISRHGTCYWTMLAILGLVAGDPCRTGAHSYYLVGGLPVTWYGNQCTRYLSPSTFPPNSDPDVQIRSAMGEWNRVPASSFAYGYVRLDQDYPVDHFDGLSDTTAVPASQLDPGVLGVTYLVNYQSEWFDTDILFSDFPGNIGYSFNPFPDCEELTNPRTHGYSFLLIALHELGHGLGLGHDPQGTEPSGSAWFPGTMNPRYPSGGTLGDQHIIELHTDDRNGLRFLYPHSGPSGAHYVDLAIGGYTDGPTVGKAIPIFMTPDQVYPGDEVVLRSEIKNLGTTNEFFVRQGFYLSADDAITSSDEPLGFLEWDLVFGDALSFDAIVAMPDDMPATQYYLGAILDDGDAITEEFEDNNTIVYCEPLSIRQLAPEVRNLGQHRATCGRPWTGPTPTVTHPLNMNPLGWSIDNPEAAMTIDEGTGVLRWTRPVPSPFLYTLIVRATNPAGSDTEVLFLGVDRIAPAMSGIADAIVACGAAYTGPTPRLNSAECMNPILVWTLDAGPAGMTVAASTGIVTWPTAMASPAAQTVTVRAVNSAGAGTVSWRLSVFPADYSGNGSMDRADTAAFVQCLGGPTPGPTQRCLCSDMDADGDADLRDFAAYQRGFGG